MHLYKESMNNLGSLLRERAIDLALLAEDKEVLKILILSVIMFAVVSDITFLSNTMC